MLNKIHLKQSHVGQQSHIEQSHNLQGNLMSHKGKSKSCGEEQSQVGHKNLIWDIIVSYEKNCSQAQRGLMWDIKVSYGTEQSHV